MNEYNVIGTGLVLFGHFTWCLNLYDNRLDKHLFKGLYLIASVLTTFLCIYLGLNYSGNFDKMVTLLFFVAFVSFSVSFFLFSKGFFLKKLFLFFTYDIFFCIIHNLSYLITSCFISPTENLFYLVGIIIRTVLHFGTLIFYVCWMKKRILKIHIYDKKQWLPLCVVSALFFCLHSFWMAIGTNVWSYHFYDKVIFLLLFVVTVGLYVIIIFTINYMNKYAEASQVEMHSKFLLDQIKNYERSEEKNRRFRHDVRHHMLHLANLIDAKDPKAALDYIEEYDKAVLSFSQKRYCQDAVINNILSSYGARFQENKIAFSVKCPMDEELKMKDIDLVSLLGNLLENAFNASVKSTQKEKKVGLYLAKQNQKFMIVCENTCDEVLELTDGIPQKKGIGILSILHVCEIYHGQVSYQVENGICSVCIVLSLL